MQRIKKAFVFIFSRVKTRLSLDELQRDIYIVTKKKKKFLPFPKPVHLQKVK